MPPLEDAAEELLSLFQALGAVNKVNAVAASGAAVALPDPTVAAVSTITLTAPCTITAPAPSFGKRIKMLLKQDGTGSRVVTWASAAGSVLWPNKTAPTLTTTAAAVDEVTLESFDGTNWIGSSVLNVG